MNYRNPLLVVKHLDQSIAFYIEVLGLHVILDFGANVTLTGGICLQSAESWADFLDKEETEIEYGGLDSELYFEEDDFDAFIEKLEGLESISYVHRVKEHAWGQRVVRIYDPDRHIIEIGEDMLQVCKRFFDSGMTSEEVAVRMDVPLEYVNAALGRLKQ